jgi:hypothetical protein
VAVGRTVSAPEVDFRSQVRHELECRRGFPSIETVSLPWTAIESENRIAGIGVPAENFDAIILLCICAQRNEKTKQKEKRRQQSYFHHGSSGLDEGRALIGEKADCTSNSFLIWLTSNL